MTNWINSRVYEWTGIVRDSLSAVDLACVLREKCAKLVRAEDLISVSRVPSRQWFELRIHLGQLRSKLTTLSSSFQVAESSPTAATIEASARRIAAVFI